MRLFIQTIILIISLVILLGCGNESFKSKKIESTIIVDGSGKDWSDIPLTYIEDLEMVIGFANNDSTLFAMFRFSDHQLAQKLHMRGAILWIDPTKDEEQQFGIKYRRQSLGPPERKTRNEFEQQQTIKLDGSFMVVQGEDEISSGLEFFPGILAAAGNDNGLYIFEYAIPLNSNKDGVLREISADLQNLAIGIKICAITEDERKELRQMRAERDGRDRSGGDMNGGKRGGGRKGGRNSMQGDFGSAPDMESEEIWLNVKIAN